MAAPETRMWSSMELVHPLEPTGEESPLARARLHRQLTVEETARRAGITAEEVRWLEEGRVYRFPKPDDALIATALYATALGLDNREARELAGLPVPPQPIERNPLARLLVYVMSTVLFPLDFTFPPSMVAAALGFTLLLTAVASIGPALAAARLKVSYALRYE